MNIYKILCCSSCGSYFSSYLQSVTIIAQNENEALEGVKKWLKDKGEHFIYPENKWEILLLSQDISNGIVIDFNNDSDY